jgi:PAS domain S-box-containing protein
MLMPKLIRLMQNHNLAAGFLLLALFTVLLTDSLTQLGFAHGILYTPLVALAGLSYRRKLLNMTACISLIAIWLGFFIAPAAPADFSMFYVLANRGISCLAVVLLWWFGAQAISLRQSQYDQHVLTSQTRLDLQLANQVAGISHWWLDDHTKTVQLDENSARLLGLNMRQLTLEQFACCFEQQAGAELKLQLEQTLEASTPLSLELRLHQESSQQVWVRLTAYADPTSPGVLRGILQDIQQHHDEAQRMQIQQRRFQQLADSLPVKVWTATADGKIDYVSETFASFSGIDANSIEADWLQLLHPDEQAPVLHHWQHCVRAKEPYNIEFRILRADGSYVWHLTSAIPIFNEQGDVLYWYGSAMDISQHKALWQNTDNLRLSLYQTLNETTDAFFALDHQLACTFINQKALELLTDPKIPALGKSITEVFYRPGKDYSALTTAIQRCYTKQSSETLSLALPDQELPVTVRLYPSVNGINVLLQLEQSRGVKG